MKFKNARTFRTVAPNGDNYVATYDYAAGRKNRYTLLVWRVGKAARVIGRELTLGHCKKLIEKRWCRTGPA